jgi:hypothetical protein
MHIFICCFHSIDFKFSSLQIRPLISHEVKRGEEVVVSKTRDVDHEIKVGDRVFTYDYAFHLDISQVRGSQSSIQANLVSNSHLVFLFFIFFFGGATTQDQVYRTAITPLVNYATQGYNVTILAYGQTVSTHTHAWRTLTQTP